MYPDYMLISSLLYDEVLSVRSFVRLFEMCSKEAQPRPKRSGEQQYFSGQRAVGIDETDIHTRHLDALIPDPREPLA